MTNYETHTRQTLCSLLYELLRGLVAGEGGCEEKGSVLAFQHFAFNLFTYSHICVKSLGNFAKNSE